MGRASDMDMSGGKASPPLRATKRLPPRWHHTKTRLYQNWAGSWLKAAQSGVNAREEEARDLHAALSLARVDSPHPLRTPPGKGSCPHNGRGEEGWGGATSVTSGVAARHHISWMPVGRRCDMSPRPAKELGDDERRRRGRSLLAYSVPSYRLCEPVLISRS